MLLLINADQLLANHWEKILSNILKKKQDTDNPYDIQQICFAYFENLESILTAEELNEVKLVAYDRGELLSAYDIVFGIETAR